MKPQTIAEMEAEQAADARKLAPCRDWPKPRRSFWRWLLSLLPLILLATASAATYTIDQWGRVTKISDYPEDRDIWIPIVNPFIFPRATPTPRPQATPPPKWTP